MRTIPLYVYFPKSEWSMIKKAEANDEEGNKILDYYSKIYKENFLGQIKMKKVYDNKNINLTNSNEKKLYKFGLKNSVKLTDFEIQMLTIN